MKHTITVPTGRVLGVLAVMFVGVFVKTGLRFAFDIPDYPGRYWIAGVEFATGWVVASIWMNKEGE